MTRLWSCSRCGKENRADLFTKHLQSRERIHGLLAFFGCYDADGRAEIAPQMRAGTGTTKGELLALAESTMKCEGFTFPAVEFEGEMLPEAFPSQPGFGLVFLAYCWLGLFH